MPEMSSSPDVDVADPLARTQSEFPSGSGVVSRPALVPKALTLLVVVVAVLIWLLGNDYVLYLSQGVFVAAIVSMALTVLSGTAGQFSLGSAALMGLGAYASAGLAVQLHWPPVATAVVALGCGAIFGLITGLPALRLRGVYLVMSTLAGHFLVLFLLQEYQLAGFGVVGIRVPRPALLESDTALFATVITAVLVALVALSSVQGKRHGRAMKAVRDRDLVAEASGIPIGRIKIFAFVFTSMIIAGAGVLQSYATGFVAVDQYGLDRAVSHVAMIIIGGLGSLSGAIVGAAVVTLLPVIVDEISPSLASVPGIGTWLTTYEAEFIRILYGMLIVVFIVAEPGGMAALARRARGWKRRARGSADRA